MHLSSGNGSVKMIVNVNPRASDYDETTNVLQFAELSQEVSVKKKLMPETLLYNDSIN